MKVLAINMAVTHRYTSVDMWKFYVSDKSLFIFVRNQNLFLFEKMVFKQESLCYSEEDLHSLWFQIYCQLAT